MKFGEKLRTLRIQKKLTQRDLAEQVGLGMNTIGNYESGKTYPKTRNVYNRLAAVLDVSVETLYNENDAFIMDVSARYGYNGRERAEQLVSEMGRLFAGGTLSDEDLDDVMRTLQEYYWRAKDELKKYAPKKSRR
jgi:transcriptional regulator with XRE-family HTH domain